MNPFLREYYNQPVFWRDDYGSDEANLERVRVVAEALPQDVRSVLDVGCANGKALLALVRRGSQETLDFVAGVDFSERALRKFDLPRVCGDCSSLPFADDSFDAAICLEVLEHLPQETFSRTLGELQRVTSRYLLISVPNAEDLRRSGVMCPKCFCWFNSSLHMRSFHEGTLYALFEPLFVLSAARLIGPLDRQYWLPLLLRELGRFLLEPAPPAACICPQCGYGRNKSINLSTLEVPSESGNSNPTSSFLKNWVFRAWPKTAKRRWLLALYERR
ncbi:MAG: class I SAM-dependent methyltransferase [Deltaproteobacteria bacterium]|nr:class I SAM-dependent methyltransferase [Deltaproteobacteria bacterium]